METYRVTRLIASVSRMARHAIFNPARACTESVGPTRRVLAGDEVHERVVGSPGDGESELREEQTGILILASTGRLKAPMGASVVCGFFDCTREQQCKLGAGRVRAAGVVLIAHPAQNSVGDGA